MNRYAALARDAAPGSALSAAYMQGCAAVHAGELVAQAIGKSAAAQNDGMGELAEALNGQRHAIDSVAESVHGLVLSIERWLSEMKRGKR
jgi:hypothetical protein